MKGKLLEGCANSSRNLDSFTIGSNGVITMTVMYISNSACQVLIPDWDINKISQSTQGLKSAQGGVLSDWLLH